MAQRAAVISLQEFRRRRETRVSAVLECSPDGVCAVSGPLVVSAGAVMFLVMTHAEAVG